MKIKPYFIALSILLVLSLITPTLVLAKGKPSKPPQTELYTIEFSGVDSIPGDITGTTYGVKLDNAKRSCRELKFDIFHPDILSGIEEPSPYSEDNGRLVWYMDKGGKAMVRITLSIRELSGDLRVYHIYVWDGEYTKMGGDRWSIATFVDDTAKLYRDYGDLSNLVLLWEGTMTFEISRILEEV